MSCSFVQKIASKTSLVKQSLPAVPLKKIDQPSVSPILPNKYLDPIFPLQNTFTQKKESVTESRLATTSTTAIEPTFFSKSGVGSQQVDPIYSTMAPPSPLLFKFSQLLDQEIEQLPDSLLLKQIDPWLGVRYQSGGNSVAGIDCSAFTATILSSYRGVQLPRTSREQYRFCELVNKNDLKVGDLLFFRTRGRSISHVGIYLGNDKFVHASSSNGVMVSDRKETYFSARYVGAGRISTSSFTKE
jgi:cell wall-associated NlpC family hydrolase